MVELLDMGKYSVFIWTSYGVSTAVICGLMVWILGQRNKTKAQLQALEAQIKSETSS